MDESSQQQETKPRRLSARIQQLRERNENQQLKTNNNNIIKQKATTSKASNTSLKQTKSTNQSTKRGETTSSNKRNGKRRRTSGAAVKSTSLARRKKAKTKKLPEPIELKEYIREDEDQYMIHPDFRLKRLKPKSFDVIRGMSKYDRENKDDVLQASPYVADLLQHHFSLEVTISSTRPSYFFLLTLVIFV